jgi:hypothetical protein
VSVAIVPPFEASCDGPFETGQVHLTSLRDGDVILNSHSAKSYE